MYVRNGIKTTLRARKRSLLFGLLIFLLTVTVTLGAGMWVYCSRMLAQCDESYTTIALIEYIGSDYNNQDAADEFSRNAAQEMKSVDIGALDGVKLWEPSENTLVSIQDYKRNSGELPCGDKAVLEVSRFVSIPVTANGDFEDETLLPQDCVVYDADRRLWIVRGEGKEMEAYPVFTEGGVKALTEQELPDRYIIFNEITSEYQLVSPDSVYENRVDTRSRQVLFPVDGQKESLPYYTCSNGRYTGTYESSSYSAYVSRVLYAADDIEGKLIMLDPGNTDFKPESGERYLIHADKIMGSSGNGSYSVSSFYDGCEELPYRKISDKPETEGDGIFQEYSQTYQIAGSYARMEASRDVSSLEVFHQGTLYLKEGRFPQEGETSACVISGTTALSMKIDVGDRICVTELVSQPSDRFDMEPSAQGPVSLTVVGITNESRAYDGCLWTSGNVFSPEGRVSGGAAGFASPKFGYQIGRCVLDNESAADTVERIENMLPEQVHVTLFDQGYAEMSRPLKMLLSIAKAVTAAGICATLVVLLLFAYLFVARQKETVSVLSSLGTPERKIGLWILSGAAVVSGVSVIFGGIAGGMVFGRVLDMTLRAAKGLYSVDRRYSETAVGAAMDAIDSGNLPVRVIAAVCMAVFSMAMMLCILFLQGMHRTGSPKKGKSRVRVPKDQTSSRGRGTARYALLAAKRGGWRSGVVMGVAFGLSMFLGMLAGSVQDKQTQLDDIYHSTMEGYIVDTSGRSALGVGVPFYEVQELSSSGLLNEILVSTGYHYWFEGEMPDFGSGHSSGDRMNAWLRKQPEITALNGLSAAPEFFYHQKWEIQWLEGWNESMFSDDRYEPFLAGYGEGVQYPALAGRNFMDEHHLSPGDTVELWTRADTAGGDYITALVTIQIVGTYMQNSSKNSIYVPLSFCCPPSLICTDEAVNTENPSWMQDMDALERYNANAGSTVFDTCRFSLKSAGVLDHFRDYLEEKEFSAVGNLKRSRTTILLKDKSFTEVTGNLERYMTFTDILLPALMAVVGLMGFVISWLMINGRKMEFAVMRGIGAGRVTVFLTFFMEQMLLCLGGSIPGILILLLMGYGKTVWIAAGTIILCYLAGCVISILTVSRINLMELLTEKE